MVGSSSGNMSEAEIEAVSREKSYLRVYALLIREAENRKTVVYGDVAAIMGLPPSGQQMGRETGRILGTINHREHACERPMLTTVVVSSVDKRPHPGNPLEGVMQFGTGTVRLVDGHHPDPHALPE